VNHRTALRPALVTGVYAADLRAAVAADPAAPVVAGIQGVGGHGKTTLLEELARIYRYAGVRVIDGATESIDQVDGAAVLVDDAHRLGDSVLRELRELAATTGARLIVAYRPWPRSEALDELVAALGRSGPPVLLGQLGTKEIAEHVNKALDSPAPPEWLEWLRAQTGGVPRFVSRMLAALSPPDLGQPRVPQRALEQFQHDLDQLDDHARQCAAAVAVGATPHPDLLASLLGLERNQVVQAMAAVRVSGMVDSEDGLLPIARQAVVLLTPWERRLGVVRRLVEMQLQRGGPVLPLVRPLLDAELALVPESTMATAFERAGDEALAESPRLAARLYDAAVSAGTAAGAVAARRAHAAAVAGDLDGALRLADQVIVDETASDRALGVQVAASVLAHRGLLARSGELCRWSVENVPWPEAVSFAAVGMLGGGRLDEAERLLKSPRDSGPPTSLSGAAIQLAEGVYESVTGSAAIALSTLVRAASLSEPVGRTILVPDTPASITTVVALHCGEFDVAESMLARAIEAGTGGPLLHLRHRLLAAWIPLVRGDTVAARTRLAASAHEGMGARDRLLATSIEAGIANRDNDMTALTAVRGHARKAVAEHAVDLFSLLPLGELIVAMARLRDQDWLAPYLQEARSLLERLGNPPLWASLLTWKSLQAAIIVENFDVAHRHATELESMAHHNPLSAALSQAARTWLRVLGGRVDQEEAEQAARGLHTAGLAWDGARLAGQAAIRTTDRPVMLALLECARSLQGKPARPRSVRDRAEADGADSSDLLSDREKEVAELVLSGLTYKQVGKRLFISAKTVEHHIGRVKQRLGCTSREDLLMRLRELLGHD
jgi:DNA-binding CsgD family transcriptional regulator